MRLRMRAMISESLMVLLFALALVVIVPGTARACSCAQAEPRDAIADSDAAFVGTLLDRREGGPSTTYSGDHVATFLFAVEHDIKGNLEEEVELVSSADGASCGLEVSEGGSTGLFLTLNEDGVWTSSLCAQIDPDVLLKAAAPLPAPDGHGPIRLLVGGNFGEARVISLDERGRTLAYGLGQGDVYDIDVCPGGRRSVESVGSGRSGKLVVRDVASLAVIREVQIVETKFPSVYLVRCLDEDGHRLLAIDDVGREVRVHEVVGDDVEVVFSARGRAWGAVIEGDVPYLIIHGRNFGRVDLSSGRFELVARLPAHTDAARLSPDGRWVAAVRYGGALPGEPPSDIVLISTEHGEIVSEPLVGWNDGGRLLWLADNRLLFLPIGEDVNRVAIYDVPSFDEIVGADRWYAGEAVVLDGVIYGTDGVSLSRVDLGTDDAAHVLRTFDGPGYALALVPGSIRAEPSSQPPGQGSGPLTRSLAADDDDGLVGLGWVISLIALVGAAFVIMMRSGARRGLRRPAGSGHDPGFLD